MDQQISVHYGDILNSTADVMCLQVNTLGVAGAGLAKRLKDKCPSAYAHYRQLCVKTAPGVLMGKTLIVPLDVNKGRFVAYCFAQEVLARQGECVTDYDALRKALQMVAEWMKNNGKKSVAIPYKMGCGLAGGDWETVKGIIVEVFQPTELFVEIWKWN
jgi:O-acetyl-ADP-ribose deacetylase (regulator of RNase III)